MLIREGNIHDVFAIASVQVKSWQTTYHGIISDEYLQGLNIPDREKKWKEILNSPDKKVFVAMEGEDIVGFVTCENISSIPENDGEISSLYILKKYQRKGIGKELWRKGIEHLGLVGKRKIGVWVLAQNPYKEFYIKQGGEYRTSKVILIDKKEYIEEAYGWIL